MAKQLLLVLSTILIVCSLCISSISTTPAIPFGDTTASDSERKSYTPPTQVHLAYTGNPTEIVVSWHTTIFTNSTVVITKEGTPFSKHFNGSAASYLHSAGYTHHVKASGLEAATKYEYKCGTEESGWSVTYSFSTAPSTSSPKDSFKFIQYGDMGIAEFSYQTVGHVSKVVKSGEVDFIYHSGDYGYGNDRPAAYYEESWNVFFEQMQEAMSLVPYMTTVGNHEYGCGQDICNEYARGYTVYNTRFRMPSLESNGSANANMFFSWNYNNVHFISISTETDYPNAPTPEYKFGDQIAWLTNDLKAANADPNVDWIIALGHRPFYCSVSGKSLNGIPINQQADLTAAFENLFHEYNVDLYMDGHVHAYERCFPTYQSKVVAETISHNEYVNPGATTYIVAGNAGNTEGFYTDWSPDPPVWSASRYWLDHGYGIMEVVGNSELKWKWYRNGDNQINDYVTISRTKPRNFKAFTSNIDDSATSLNEDIL